MHKTFMPTDADTVSIAATITSARVALDQYSSVVRVQNKGPGEVFIQFGSGTVVSTTAKMGIASGATETFTKGAATHVAAVCAGADTATVRFTNGEGL